MAYWMYKVYILWLPMAVIAVYLACDLFQPNCNYRNAEYEKHSNANHLNNAKDATDIARKSYSKTTEQETIKAEASPKCSIPCRIINKALDDAVALFTGLLVYVVYLQLLFANRQETWLRRSFKAAAASVRIASRSVLATMRIERAYVFAEIVLDSFGNSLVGQVPFGSMEVTVKFWNYGKTPAVIKMIRGYIIDSDEIPQELLDFEGAEMTLPPGLGISTNCAYPVRLDFKFGVDQFSAIKQANRKIYVVGKIEYSTIDKQDCVTGFCWHLIYRDVGSSITLTRDSRLNVHT